VDTYDDHCVFRSGKENPEIEIKLTIEQITHWIHFFIDIATFFVILLKINYLESLCQEIAEYKVE